MIKILFLIISFFLLFFKPIFNSFFEKFIFRKGGFDADLFEPLLFGFGVNQWTNIVNKLLKHLIFGNSHLFFFYQLRVKFFVYFVSSDILTYSPLLNHDGLWFFVVLYDLSAEILDVYVSFIHIFLSFLILVKHTFF